MSQPTPDDIRQLLADGMNCCHLQVAGDGVHFQALIVSDEFSGLSKIKRHQLVYRLLGSRMQSEIHALSMRTLTSDEWDG